MIECLSGKDKTEVPIAKITHEDSSYPPVTKKLHELPRSVIEIDYEEAGFEDIYECPTIKLHDSDMTDDPLSFFMNLERLYRDYGAVKLEASKNWQPPFMFNYQEKGITTRIQVLQHLSEGKAFEQKVEAYTMKKYYAYAKDFEINYRYRTDPPGSDAYVRDEYEFWSLVSDSKYKEHKTKVEYAADLPSSKFGSGFPVHEGYKSKDKYFNYANSLYNLNNLYKSNLSMLKIIDLKGDVISGVTSPWVYMGMKYASFCWHVEDLYINSMNYMHKGSPKTWYIIPESNKYAFDNYVKEKFSKQFEMKPDFLHRITLLINPIDLKKAGIKVYKIRQQEKSYVCTFSKVYHAGFSHGFNIAEAVNFASPLSFYYIRYAVKDYEKCLGKKMAIFPFEWIVYENYENRYNYKIPARYEQYLYTEYRYTILEEFYLLKIALSKHYVKEYSYYDKKNIKYDKNVCLICRNYCYLTHFKCTDCKKIYCLWHIPEECCDKNEFKLMMREPNEDRRKLLTLLNEACQVIE